MTNPFEGHLPNPRAEAQFEEVNQEKFAVLLEEAQAKAEGFILYAPIEQKHKDILLSELSEASDQERLDFMTLLRQNNSEEQAAATIFQRRLRWLVDSLRLELTPKDYTMMCIGVERLTSVEGGAFDGPYAQWMQSGVKE